MVKVLFYISTAIIVLLMILSSGCFDDKYDRITVTGKGVKVISEPRLINLTSLTGAPRYHIIEGYSTCNVTYIDKYNNTVDYQGSNIKDIYYFVTVGETYNVEYISFFKWNPYRVTGYIIRLNNSSIYDLYRDPHYGYT